MAALYNGDARWLHKRCERCKACFLRFSICSMLFPALARKLSQCVSPAGPAPWSRTNRSRRLCLQLLPFLIPPRCHLPDPIFRGLRATCPAHRHLLSACKVIHDLTLASCAFFRDALVELITRWTQGSYPYLRMPTIFCSMLLCADCRCCLSIA